MLNVDEEWQKYLCSNDNDTNSDIDFEEIIPDEIIYDENYISTNISNDLNNETPKASNIYISTKTKIAYLDSEIDLKKVFWDVPIIAYSTATNGVIKKQIKFNSTSIEELDIITEKLKNEKHFDEYIITNINNPTGRIKFKDIRKVTIGISKKDILSYRCKKKSAFYNCFVLILRMKVDKTFKEFHVKVFNTGKLEIPGIQSEDTFHLILKFVIDILQPHIDHVIDYKENSNENVLINSNFNCGFFINREILYNTLKYKYNIQAIFDPCSYPGIQCKFYYNPEIDVQTGSQISEENKSLYKNITAVSFMIFRTGSVLIVGKCDENTLFIIYEFLKNLFINEYKEICQKINVSQAEQPIIKDKKKVVRKKTITITS